jgi:hypothetical protein
MICPSAENCICRESCDHAKEHAEGSTRKACNHGSSCPACVPTIEVLEKGECADVD